ncbi:hypothetical protein IMZ48_34370 [Candidatus Bathyarchaeota archaeon]|nr:hypothetical protein [Candidatus Bathyarchaeota archaeon]
MNTIISPPKLVLLAAHLTSQGDIDSLSFLVSRHSETLRRDLVLRILLTYLPETVHSHAYVPFLQELASGDFADYDPVDIDDTTVASLTEEDAIKKVRRLRLIPLTWKDGPVDLEDDSLGLFLLLRARRVDEGAGLLSQLPDLIVPFLHNVPLLRPWMVSVLLPLLRRNYHYYPRSCTPHTLEEFRALPDPAAVALLLSETGVREDDLHLVGRDMRGLIGPWLHDPSRWKQGAAEDEALLCPGFEVVLDWLTAQASTNWKLALQVIEEWDGPVDSDLGDLGDSWWTGEQRSYLQRRYIRAALASAYLIPDSTPEALVGAHKMASRAAALLGIGPLPPLQPTASLPTGTPQYGRDELVSAKATSYMRNGHLEDSNLLTSPDERAVRLLGALVTSSSILTKAGISCSIRRAGDLLFLRDGREQKSEASKFLHAVASRGPKNDDTHWVSARRDLLWLWSWEPFDSMTATDKTGNGIFGAVDRQFLETELLREILTATRRFSTNS